MPITPNPNDYSATEMLNASIALDKKIAAQDLPKYLPWRPPIHEGASDADLNFKPPQDPRILWMAWHMKTQGEIPYEILTLTHSSCLKLLPAFHQKKNLEKYGYAPAAPAPQPPEPQPQPPQQKPRRPPDLEKEPLTEDEAERRETRLRKLRRGRGVKILTDDNEEVSMSVAWFHLFEGNAVCHPKERLTDPQLEKAMLEAFPGQHPDAKAARRKYNRGLLPNHIKDKATKVRPYRRSVAYTSEGYEAPLGSGRPDITEGKNTGQWWTYFLQENEAAPNSAKLTDAQLVEKMIELYPDAAHDIQAARRRFNKGKLPGQGRPPRHPSYQYIKRAGRIIPVTPRGVEVRGGK